MIISASRRTDIPALYSNWFFDRLKDGWVESVNPFNAKQRKKIILTPENIDFIVFWTKDPNKMIKKLRLLNGFDFYFQYTLNGYNKDIEKNITSLNKRLDTFKMLSDSIGPQQVLWRYDPIFFTDKYTFDLHLDLFNTISEKLSGYTHRCTFSFMTMYKKTIRNTNHLSISEPGQDKHIELITKMNNIANQNNISLYSCSSKVDFTNIGVKPGACIDGELIRMITKRNGLKLKKDKNQRQNCNCVKAIDIGKYKTCTNDCIYCYAR